MNCKKIVTISILSLAGAVLIWGLIMSSMAFADNFAKLQTSSYDKNGKSYQAGTIAEADAYRYTNDSSFLSKSVSTREYYKRIMKAREIDVKTAEKELDIATAAGVDTTIETAKKNLASEKGRLADAKATYKREMGLYVRNGSANFFSNYFPVVALLLIAALINMRLEYGKKKE